MKPETGTTGVRPEETVVLGGGCFWCTEALYQRLHGILKVTPGYAGGTALNPTYEAICTGKTDHAEVIQVTFDPVQISFNSILTVFFATHDPTSINQQGNDIGPQYRSIILYTTPQQKAQTQSFIKTLQKETTAPIVTEIQPLKAFYPAEKEHHGYYNNNTWQPYCQVIIAPKISKLKEKFYRLLKKSTE